MNIEEYRDMMYYNMAYFGEMCFPTTFKKRTPDFHYEIYDKLSDPGYDRLLVVAPRFHAKSTLLALVYVLWKIMFTPAGEMNVIVLVSKTRGHAMRLLGTIKHHLCNSEMIRAIFGDWGRETWLVDRVDELVLKDNTMIGALGTGQQIDGFKVIDQRPNIILFDDPEDENNTKTIESRDANHTWLLRAAIPALSEDGRFIVMGTVIHSDCMVVRLGDATGWTKMWYAAHNYPDEPKRTLWPELWSHEKLEKMRLSYKSQRKEHIYWMQLENQIMVPEDQLFKPEDIQYYEGSFDVDKYNEVVWLNQTIDGKTEHTPLTVFIGVDPAKSISEGRDYTVIMVVGISPKRDIYVIDYIRKRMLPNTIADEVVRVNKTWCARRANVEDVLFSGLIGDALKEKMVESNQYVSVNKIPIPTNMDKKARYQESLVDIFVRKKIYIQKKHTEFYQEFVTFVPGRSKHDDMLDGLWLALRKYYPPPSDLTYTQPDMRIYENYMPELDWRKL